MVHFDEGGESDGERKRTDTAHDREPRTGNEMPPGSGVRHGRPPPSLPLGLFIHVEGFVGDAAGVEHPGDAAVGAGLFGIVGFDAVVSGCRSG